MPAGGGRFGPQGLVGQFTHLQQSHIPHSNQHHPPGSAGLPPPSFHTHPGFQHANQSSTLNSLAGLTNTNGLATAFSGVGGVTGGIGLGSNAAAMSFHQASSSQQHSRDSMRRPSGMGKGQNKGRIRDVWQGNLAQEMQNLRELVEKYPYISMVCCAMAQFR